MSPHDGSAVWSKRANAAGLRPRAANSEPDERTQAEQEYHRHEHGVGAREPRDAPAARHNGDDDGQGRGIGEAGERAKSRVRQAQPAAQQPLLRQAREDRFRVTQAGLRSVGQDDDPAPLSTNIATPRIQAGPAA
jgi:hypothetical protein